MTAATPFGVDMGRVPGYFYPFGPGEGDSVAPDVDDGTTGSLPLSQSITYYGNSYNHLYVRSVQNIRCKLKSGFA